MQTAFVNAVALLIGEAAFFHLVLHLVIYLLAECIFSTINVPNQGVSPGKLFQSMNKVGLKTVSHREVGDVLYLLHCICRIV